MGKTVEWARVVEHDPSEGFGRRWGVYVGADRVRGCLTKGGAITCMELLNAALDAHPEIVRWKAIEKAAEKMAEALEQLNMECRMADNRGELAGEVDGGTMDNAESALKAYEKSKAQGKGGR